MALLGCWAGRSICPTSNSRPGSGAKGAPQRSRISVRILEPPPRNFLSHPQGNFSQSPSRRSGPFCEFRKMGSFRGPHSKKSQEPLFYADVLSGPLHLCGEELKLPTFPHHPSHSPQALDFKGHFSHPLAPSTGVRV